MKITCLADVEEFERTPYRDRWRAKNTYDLICQAANNFPDRPAMKFQSTPELDEEAIVVTYKELRARVIQTANALHAAEVNIGGTTSIILPNLPENHYTLWGAQALGIAGQINYMLEPAALRDIMIESETQALVVLGPSPDFDIWEKTLSIIDQVPTLKTVLRVNSHTPEQSASQTTGGVAIRDFTTALSAQNSSELVFERDINVEEVGIYFHTGG
ncbi:MAG: AMP-binding protein, partial [Pseudomonadota bacterium]